MKACLVVLAAVLGVLSCTPEPEGTADAGGTQQTGGSCSNAGDCPDGFACKARACVRTCTSNTPVVGGCVVGATCNNGHCAKNTTCSATTDCAFDKGEVCQFSTGQCITATETCTERETVTPCTPQTDSVCNNGFLCHVSVCYVDCTNDDQCPCNETCVNNQCQ